MWGNRYHHFAVKSTRPSLGGELAAMKIRSLTAAASAVAPPAHRPAAWSLVVPARPAAAREAEQPVAAEAEPERLARRRMSDAVFGLALPRPGAAAAVMAAGAGPTRTPWP